MDEVTDSSRHQLLGMHVYFMRGGCREVHFVAAAVVEGAPNADKIVGVVMRLLTCELAMSPTDIATKLVSIGTDGASVMTGEHVILLCPDAECWIMH